jgi:hypothetical protein
MLRRVISTGKIALLVLPYVSICTEKVLYFFYFSLKLNQADTNYSFLNLYVFLVSVLIGAGRTSGGSS